MMVPLTASNSRRFWAKCQERDLSKCWEWQGGISSKGYGRFSRGSRSAGGDFAHRVVYEWAFGPIPGGLHIDHLCRNRACVNPLHLEAVTPKENIRRSPIHVGARTHCPSGHAYDDENTAFRRDGSRRCRACDRDQSRALYQGRRGYYRQRYLDKRAADR